MTLLNNYSIKIKVSAGFVLMMLLLLAASVSALVNLLHTKNDVVLIANDIQPAVMKATELQYHLERANSSLGFYLLSQEETHKKRYLDSLKQVDEALADLQSMKLVQSNPAVQKEVTAIATDVAKFKQYKDEVITLATDSGKNIPATAFAAKNISPISQQMLQLLSTMMQSETNEDANQKRRALLLDMSNLRYSLVTVLNGLRGYLAFRKQAALDEMTMYSETVDNLIAKLDANSNMLTLDEADSFDQFKKLRQDFSEKLKTLISIHGGEKWRTDSYLVRTKIGPLVDQIGTHVNNVVNFLRDRVSDTSQGLESQVSGTTKLVGLLLLLGVVFGAVIAWAISRSIVIPITHALDAMADIAGGEGDLTRRLDDSGNDEISQLAHGFNLFSSIVQNMVREVSGYTERLAGEAARLTVVTEETSKGADFQQSETDQVATAVNQLAATGHEVARNASHAAEAAYKADEAATRGRQVVGHTIESIDTLAREVEKASSVINRLEKDSESIGGVLDVIRGVAEQTNLLALNAAIEAARAGEQGRGFAVVADEVRTLASRTQTSTAEIQTMIERLQSGARDAVSVMDHSRSKAEQTVGQAAKAGTSLEEITSSVKIINDLNGQIASAAEEQNSVAEDINRKVSRISEITDQTAAGAQQTASASNELNRLAEHLKKLVAQFKV